MALMNADAARLMTELRDLAVRGLAAMLDARTGLFPQKVVLAGDSVEHRGQNPLYSAMSLVGLLSIDAGDSWPAGASVARAIDAVADAAVGSGDPALAGTGMWALALAGDARAAGLVTELHASWSGEGRPTMEIALVVSGAVSALESFPSCRDEAARLAERGARLLVERWSPKAQLFAGSRAWRPKPLLARHLTSFANQAYPLHALARHARVVSDRIPPCALRTADRLVELQGSLGQWWWLYSARDGRVLDGYPVYSVHQDGMAFLGLALLDAPDRYAEALQRGLRWIDGANELERSLVDREHDLVLRCIQRSGSDPDASSGMQPRDLARAQLASWSIARPVGARCRRDRLEVLHECRPYHLGWVLYACSLAAPGAG